MGRRCGYVRALLCVACVITELRGIVSELWSRSFADLARSPGVVKIIKDHQILITSHLDPVINKFCAAIDHLSPSALVKQKPSIPHTHGTMSSALKFLVGGYGKTITLFSFDAASKSLNVVKSNSGFVAPTWVEASVSSTLRGKVFYAVSEENGQVQSLELKEDGSLTVTGSAPTNGNPAHSMSFRRTIRCDL